LIPIRAIIAVATPDNSNATAVVKKRRSVKPVSRGGTPIPIRQDGVLESPAAVRLATMCDRTRFRANLATKCPTRRAQVHEEFSRRVKTQGSLPSKDAAGVLLFSLVATGQIKLRRIDGWQKIATVLSQNTLVAA